MKTIFKLSAKSLYCSFSKKIILFFIAFFLTGSLRVCSSEYMDKILTFIPEKSSFLILADMTSLKEAEFSESLSEREEFPQEYRDFIQMTGINPEEDIRYIAGFGIFEDIEDSPVGGVIVRAEYDKEKLLSLIKEESRDRAKELRETKLSSITLYSLSFESDEEDVEFWISFPEDGYVLLGGYDALELIDTLIKDKKGYLSRESALYRYAAPPRSSSIISAALILGSDMIPEEMLMVNPLIAGLAGLEAVQLALGLEDSALEVIIYGFRDDEMENAQLAGMLNGFKGMAMMGASENPDAMEYIQRITVSHSAEAVSLRLVIPKELLFPPEEE